MSNLKECTRVEGVGAQSKERKGSNFAIWQPCTQALLFATLTVACDFLLRDGLASVEDIDFGAFMRLYRIVTWTGTILWMINAVANLWSMDRVEEPRN